MTAKDKNVVAAERSQMDKEMNRHPYQFVLSIFTVQHFININCSNRSVASESVSPRAIYLI